MQVKRISLLAVAAVITVSLLSTSCKKSSSDSNNAAFSATIKGAAFNPTATVAMYTDFAGSFDIIGYYIKGTDSAAVDVTIFKPFTVGKPVTTYYSGVAYYSSGTNSSFDYGDYVGNSNSLTITVTSLDSVNHKIAGTFSGVIWNTIGGRNGDSAIISNGKFNTSFIAQ
ncbi:MAG TPA: hypothetical protein VGE93_04395 [Bryobacteraceae bacterium]